MTVTKSHSEEILMKQLQNYHKLITDTWKYIKCFTENLPTTDTEWQRMIDAGNRVIEENGDTTFARAVVMAAAEEIDRISKFKQVI